MAETHVVTCFLMDGGGKVLILRRGERVGTHRGKWAGVSGYLEAEPLEQAYTELSEEVGLGREEVELLRRGEALAIPDPSLDRTWVVHPFLFRVHDPSKIRLDWEHTESRWIDPSELAAYPTVPGLSEVLRALLPRA